MTNATTIANPTYNTLKIGRVTYTFTMGKIWAERDRVFADVVGPRGGKATIVVFGPESSYGSCARLIKANSYNVSKEFHGEDADAIREAIVSFIG